MFYLLILLSKLKLFYNLETEIRCKITTKNLNVQDF